MKNLISFSGSDRPYVIQKQLVGSSRRTPTNGKFAKKWPRSRTVRRLFLGSLDKL